MCPQSYTCMDVDILSMDPFQTKISYSLLHRLTLFALCIWALISVSEMVTQAIFCFSTGFHKWRLWGLIQGSRIHETADRYHWLLRSSEAQAMGFAGSLGRGDMRKMPGLRLGLLEACQPAKHVVHDSLCCTMNPAMWVFRAMLNCHPVLTLQTRSAFWYFGSPWFFTRFITVMIITSVMLVLEVFPGVEPGTAHNHNSTGTALAALPPDEGSSPVSLQTHRLSQSAGPGAN